VRAPKIIWKNFCRYLPSGRWGRISWSILPVFRKKSSQPV